MEVYDIVECLYGVSILKVICCTWDYILRREPHGINRTYVEAFVHELCGNQNASTYCV